MPTLSRKYLRQLPPGPRHWFRQLQPRDQRTLLDLGEWLGLIQWDWLMTLTFPWNVSAETAMRKLCMFLDLLECRYGANVCVVGSMEAKPRTYGMKRAPPLSSGLKSHAKLDPTIIKHYWLLLVRQKAGNVDREDSIRIDRYDSAKPGIEYALKSLTDCTGHWFIVLHRVDVFHPGIGLPADANHRARRRARRAKEQECRLRAKRHRRQVTVEASWCVQRARGGQGVRETARARIDLRPAGRKNLSPSDSPICGGSSIQEVTLDYPHGKRCHLRRTLIYTDVIEGGKRQSVMNIAGERNNHSAKKKDKRQRRPQQTSVPGVALRKMAFRQCRAGESAVARWGHGRLCAQVQV